jgi:hypothetical protein
MKFLSQVLIIVIISLGNLTADSSKKIESVCWPLHYAGITTGVNIDSQIIRLLGKGASKQHNGEMSRFYIDKKHAATLIVTFYTDKVIGDIELLMGTKSLNKSEMVEAESSYFDPTEGFGAWNQLKLGSTQEDVVSNLGKPVSVELDHGWKYTTSCSCEIQSYFVIYFSEGRINRVVFSSPPG